MPNYVEKKTGFCGTHTKCVEFSGYDSWGAHELYVCKLIGTWSVVNLLHTNLDSKVSTTIFVQPLHTDAYGKLKQKGFFPNALQIVKNPDLAIFHKELQQYALNALHRRRVANVPPSTYEFISRTDPRYRVKHPIGLGRPRG